ncbi:hypothetical protein ESA_03374 [Cronobacter sakazakii ATCC BAA-894]|uniref:Uncharacterized protein n=1 Tax=Cronobacter sakazakii (strain ATCC BAA-894) TaxID=290339 RepID=A7MGB4_CROS8|nr:hypothetical protein ESA_03374 [Cronobacter sakazakii ATCC BAA-894]
MLVYGTEKRSRDARRITTGKQGGTTYSRNAGQHSAAGGETVSSR